MSRKRSHSKYIGNTMRTVGMNTTELVGIKAAGGIAGTITGPGAAIGNAAIGTGFGLAGVSGLTNTAFGKGGVLDSMKMLDSGSKRRRKR